jgi:hypothetical protein
LQTALFLKGLNLRMKTLDSKGRNRMS